jgi:Ca-activated chloride channel family protein
MKAIVMDATIMGATAMSAATVNRHLQIWPDRPKHALRMGVRIPQIMAAIVTAIATFFVCLQAGDVAANPVSPGQIKAGSLLLRDGNDFVEAPRLGADYDLTVSGPTIRGRVTQIFHNHTSNWVEAVYVYPLPEDGAVDTLKMVIGERVVVGEIKERQTARAIYEQAKASGYKTTLIEQERPNIFTNSVANIGPGETVLVQLEYQAPVKQSAGTFSLRIPLVVGPRYNPKPIVQTVDFSADGPGSNSGWGKTADPVPDRDRIEPPVLNPRVSAPVNPVQVTVRLQAGFPLGEVKSHHHQVTTDTASADTQVIKLAEGPLPADRDFELTWTSAANAAPSVGLFRERVGNDDYLLAFVTPPAGDQQQQQQQTREAIFVIDNSGSMGGTSIVQAKASLIYALGRLKPSDRFNVIRFDNTYDMLFGDSVPANADNIARARAFVTALEARGGTEMVPALRAALTDTRPVDANTLRQVVFLTDGAIGNEQQLFDALAGLRGRSRVFMVGIGSAPNSFLITRAAEIGRGTFTHIGSAEQVEERMRALFDKLESPAVTNLSVRFSNAQADITPELVPDLYRGEPLVLAAKVSALDGMMEIKGRIGDQPWTLTLPLAKAAEGQGLSKLWARRKIADAEVARTLRKATPEETDKRILALGLDHQLVTRLTSLVAVDKTPSRPDGARLARADLPLNLPAGWDFDKVFGERPQTERKDDRAQPHAPQPDRAGAPQRDALAKPATDAVAAKYARAVPVAAAPIAIATRAPAAHGVMLPQTATDADLRMIAGFILVFLSLIIMAGLRWRAGLTWR